MPPPPTIRIVCPCYFDVPSLLKVRAAAKAALGDEPRVLFVVVDDAAGLDPAIGGQLAPLADVTVIRPPRNLGHQGALAYGLRQAAPGFAPDDIVVSMDSDGEDRPEDIPALIAPLLRTPLRPGLVAVARRTQRTETAFFRISYFCFKVFFRVATGTVIRSGNFVAARGALFQGVIFHPYFDRCYSSSFISLPLELAMVPLPRGRRYAGNSKMSAPGLIGHGLRMLLPFTGRIGRRVAVAAAGFALLVAALAAAPHFRPHFPPLVPAPVAIGGVAVALLAGSAGLLASAQARRLDRLYPLPAGQSRARATSASLRR